jgi:glyoxylase-like metal-dependent hydrolase (beta-lactamase superfamily II)
MTRRAEPSDRYVAGVTVRVRPLECGWLETDASRMVTGQTGRMRIPVPAFAVEHPRGTLVFDTGMHPEVIESTARLRETAPLFDIELTTDRLLPAQLAAAGIDASTVTHAAVSHLHFDHAGGLCGVPNAQVLVQRDEWQAAFRPGLVKFGVFNPDDFDIGLDRVELDGEHDVFGDGSVRLVPTPGHTRGHQSLLVEGRLLLVGDACYCRLALDLDALPGFAADPDQQRKTFAWLREQASAGIELVFSHDAAQWVTLRSTI